MDDCETFKLAKLKGVTERYLRLQEAAGIQRFLARGGELHIASEHRPIVAIQALMREGHTHFAEKYCQEMVKKWSNERIRNAPRSLSFFGSIQSNKVRKILSISDSVEGIANLKVALRLRALQEEMCVTPRFFMQVNISREPQKNGCFPEQASHLFHQIKYEAGIDITGVMIIPQKNTDPTPAFRWARAFADKHALQHCVMGMSLDYQLAIDCGATIIRIGRLVWGATNGLPWDKAPSQILTTESSLPRTV